MAFYQETDSGLDKSRVATKYSTDYSVNHAPGHKGTLGLSYSVHKDSSKKIFGNLSDNTGSIQAVFLGNGNKTGKAPRYATIFNIYAPTSPTASNEHMEKYMTFLDALVDAVDDARATGCAIYIIGDFNVAPDPNMDRNADTTTDKQKELFLWLSIVSRLQMADVFRHRHPDVNAHTFVSHNSQSRIDHVL